MKKILVLMLAAVIAVSATGCVITDPDDTSTTISDVPASAQESQQEESSVPSEESSETSQTATVGQSVEGPDWKISLLSAKTYDKITDGMLETTPDEGKVYLVCFFEVENVSDEDNYFNYFYIESYVDGYNEDISVLLSDVDGNSILSGDVAAGKKLKGYLAWQVDPAWEELEVSYKSDVWTGDKAATFVVTPDQVSE